MGGYFQLVVSGGTLDHHQIWRGRMISYRPRVREICLQIHGRKCSHWRKMTLCLSPPEPVVKWSSPTSLSGDKNFLQRTVRMLTLLGPADRRTKFCVVRKERKRDERKGETNGEKVLRQRERPPLFEERGGSSFFLPFFSFSPKFASNWISKSHDVN